MGSPPEITYFLRLVRSMAAEGAGRLLRAGGLLPGRRPPPRLVASSLAGGLLPGLPAGAPMEQRGRGKDGTWENTVTLPVSSFTVWMVPWSTVVPTTFPVTCPLLLTTATVSLLTEK